MTDAGAGAFFGFSFAAELRTFTFKKLKTSSCRVMCVISDDDGEVSPFYVWGAKKLCGGEPPPLSTTTPARLAFILFNSHFHRLFRFFCPIIPPVQGGMALKTAKRKCNQPQRKHFIFLGAPCRTLNRHKSLQAQETGLKYSKDWRGCANKLHIGNSQTSREHRLWLIKYIYIFSIYLVLLINTFLDRHRDLSVNYLH